MGLLDIFRRKKKEKKTLENVESAKSLTELEQLCEGDREVYEALANTMFLDPRKIGVSIKDAVDNAKKFEKAKDIIRARVWYEIAGGLAIYEGDVKKVKQYFSECEKISPERKYLILRNPEKAVTKAQEYYRKYLKD